MTKFRRQVHSGIFEIDKEKGLVRISDFHLMDGFHVFNHVRFKLLVILFPLKDVRLGSALPCKTVNLV